MSARKFVIMGAGQVGCYLARGLSEDGHLVTLIDDDPTLQAVVEEQLDVGFVLGNGSHVPVLEAADVGGCELFIAASSSDEANLAASLLAKSMGAPRTVVRVQTSEDVTQYGRVYERTFKADLLLSTQLLATTQVLNHVLGYNTLEIEYLADGALQIRRTSISEGSILAERPIAESRLPKGCLVLALISNGQLTVPHGGDRAKVGDDALVIGSADAITRFERHVSGTAQRLGKVVIAGAGETACSVVEGLAGQAQRILVIESDRRAAEAFSERFAHCDVVHGDVTDAAVLASEGIDRAQAFIALTGHDETNLMACLLAQELGVKRLTALVRKSETSSLWRKMALLDIVSPRTVAAERIRNYIDSNYEPHIVSFENGAAAFVQRRVFALSPTAGARLEDVEVPQGLIVAAILRGGKAVIPSGRDRLTEGDDVVLFVARSEMATAHLLFPGSDAG